MTISDSARRNIIYTLKAENIRWSGRLDDVDFLSRIYDLSKLPSKDARFNNALADIWQHRINWPDDWSYDWIFDDDRFDLRHCSDSEFLRFLCEMIHPTVRPDRKEAELLLQTFNRELGPEGYQIVERRTEFGNLRYEPIGIVPQTIDALEQFKEIALELKSDYLQSQIVRLTSAAEKDPELAIGTAKEFVETVCKTILKLLNKPVADDVDFQKLVYLTMQEVRPVTEKFDSHADKLIQKMLGVLLTLVQCVGEIRNLYGTGHGKDASVNILEPRHAALVVNAAVTLAIFLYESYNQQEKRPSL